MGGACSAYGERIGLYRDLVGKLEGKRPLGRTRLKWEDNIRTDRQEVGCGGMDWIELAQVRECGNEPSGSKNAGNFLTSLKPVSVSRRTLLHGVSK